PWSPSLHARNNPVACPGEAAGIALLYRECVESTPSRPSRRPDSAAFSNVSADVHPFVARSRTRRGGRDGEPARERRVHSGADTWGGQARAEARTDATSVRAARH